MNHRDGADLVVVDHQEVWQGSKDRPVDLAVVEAFFAEAVRRYPGAMSSTLGRASIWPNACARPRIRVEDVHVQLRQRRAPGAHDVPAAA